MLCLPSCELAENVSAWISYTMWRRWEPLCRVPKEFYAWTVIYIYVERVNIQQRHKIQLVPNTFLPRPAGTILHKTWSVADIIRPDQNMNRGISRSPLTDFTLTLEHNNYLPPASVMHGYKKRNVAYSLPCCWQTCPQLLEKPLEHFSNGKGSNVGI